MDVLDFNPLFTIKEFTLIIDWQTNIQIMYSWNMWHRGPRHEIYFSESFLYNFNNQKTLLKILRKIYTLDLIHYKRNRSLTKINTTLT